MSGRGSVPIEGPTAVPGPTSVPVRPSERLPHAAWSARLVPRDNPPALVGYYLAVLSLVPVLGIVPAIGAILCGASGLRRSACDRERRGRTHAWIALAGGSTTAIVWIGYIVLRPVEAIIWSLAPLVGLGEILGG